MPPWHADPRFGEFRNARGLTQEQIDTVVAWVDGGAPKGDDADLPELPAFAVGWSHGEPDYVLEQPVEYHVPAQGEVEYLDFFSRVPFEEDIFIQAVEMRPGNRAAVHHSGAYMVSMPEGTVLKDGLPFTSDGEPLDRDKVQLGDGNQGTSKLVSYVPGRGYEAYGRGAAKRISAGEYIRWDMHYNSMGVDTTDRSKLGFYFYDGEPTHEVDKQLECNGSHDISGERTGVAVHVSRGRCRLAGDSPERGRLGDRQYYRGAERYDDPWADPASALAWEGDDICGHISRRSDGDVAQRAHLRFQLAALLRLRRGKANPGR